MSRDAPDQARPPLRVAILQSNYLPWKGYFDIVHDVDLFVFYDCVQYTPRDWRNRNKIKTANGTPWLSVPVAHERESLIHQVTLPSPHWQAKHWQTVQQAYGRCAHFARYREYFEHVYLGQTWTSLSDLNQQLIRHISAELLGIGTRFEDSRTFRCQGQKQDRLLDLLRKAGATSYLSGPAARDYIDPAGFEAAGIELHWKDYGGYPEYPQRFGPFVHGVSIIDLLFNVGPDAPGYIWGWRN